MASSSGETVGTVLTALHQAVTEQTVALESAQENDAAYIKQTLEDQNFCMELARRLEQSDRGSVIVEIPLPPRAAGWLPKSLQALVATPAAVEYSINEDHKLHVPEPLVQSLKTVADKLINKVSSSRSRSPSASKSFNPGLVQSHVDHFEEMAQQQQQQQQAPLQ